MKNLLLILFTILCFPSLSFSKPFTLEQLSGFSKQNSYTDNKDKISQDKIYSAWKDCCDLKPYPVITAFPGKEGFKQVALWCDQCGTQELTDKIAKVCEKEFKSLYESLTGDSPTESIMSSIKDFRGPNNKILQTDPLKLRISTGHLKCDGAGGRRLRLDFFAQ